MSPKDRKTGSVLAALPSVDEILKSPEGVQWLSCIPRKLVIQGIREGLDTMRKAILEGRMPGVSLDLLKNNMASAIQKASSFSLRPVINATGIVIHTNLGRSVLSEKIIRNVGAVAAGYSNLEYDLESGKRGKRYAHVKRLIRDITGAEDAVIVNNNAAAVLLCLNTVSKGRETVVSRSELVEIGGSFRIPDVMAESGAMLREVGTTNKTHLRDYEHAINENTALILKVHKSNYRIIGFTEEVEIEDLASLGRRCGIPVMNDLGSGCLINLRPYGIHTEPTVQQIIDAGADLVTFSGDKLLGGPQGGIIAGRKNLIERIQKNPLTRAMRIDKFTIAAFEATFMEYMNPETVVRSIPTLSMLLEKPDTIRTRARRIASLLRKKIPNTLIRVENDVSRAGGGSLPETEFPTFVVSVRPEIPVVELESRLRRSSPPVIARIKDDALLLDARTIRETDIQDLLRVVAHALAA